MKKIYLFLLVLLCTYGYTSAQYVVNGNAVQLAPSEYRLTQAQTNQGGSVWYQVRLDLRYNFTINAELFLGFDNGGADGLAFVLQPLSSGIGGVGGGIGYYQINPSLAVEFDTWTNTEYFDPTTPNADHIGFMENGNIGHLGEGIAANMLPQKWVALPNIEDGNYRPATFVWNATAKSLTVTYRGNTYIYTKDIVANLFSNSPYVYWGFTAATGAAVNEHKVKIGVTSFVQEISINTTPTPVSCPGLNDGSATLAVTGGIAPYTIVVNSTTFTGSDGSINMGSLAAGPYTVSVTDNAGVTKSGSFTIGVAPDVTAPVPNVTNLPDVLGQCGATVTAPTATDNCNGTITATTSDPTAYTSQGEFTINWVYDDGNGNTSSQTQKVVVNDNTIPTITAPTDLLNVGADVGKCYATISNLGTPVTGDNCAVDISTLTNNAPATFPIGTTIVQWTVKDVNGNTSEIASQTVTVVDNKIPVIEHNGNKLVSNDAGKCAAAVSVIANATDNCSVGTPTGVRSDNKPLTDDYPVGVTTITWTVTDANGNDAVALEQTVTVTNAGPVVNPITAPVAPVAITSPVGVSATFADNNVTGATINWGNGITTAGTVNTSTNTVSGSYTYPAPGVYRITISLTDACNATASQEYEYVVVYDPNGSFVTGGGFINSPEGAYIADPTLTGRANFGFVSKYLKGATVPTGNTEFQFHAGDLNFKSIKYEWLVVSGAKAQFKGEGTINGEGSYGFLLSAVDGNVGSTATTDKFRIKIWNITTSQLVYDNQHGSTDDALATTAIQGGSIVVHTAKGGKSVNELNARAAGETIAEGKLSVKVLGNPSAHSFTLITQSSNTQPIGIRILDAAGRTVEIRNGAAANGVYTLGSNYRSGVYFAQVVQGSEKVVVKLVKN